MSACPSCQAETGDIAKFCPTCGAVVMRTKGDADDITGRIIAGKYRVEGLLGEGGMGKVYKATQVALDKTVVLKVLRASLLSDTRTVARFQREAKAASRLNHPNSIGIIDFGQGDDGSMYIAMEYVSGKDLHQVLSAEGPLPEHRIVRVVGQVLSALTEAHAAGVIHRDLKPENIMVEQRRGEPDFVKVLDFGIAKIQETEPGSEGQALTRAGFVCGTPEYMSPEQARGAQLDARSDLYAVGVILYQCATNTLPFESDSAVGLATMHLTQEPVPPKTRRPDALISGSMERLILRAMAKDPNDRPQSAEEFRNDLLSLLKADEQTRVQALNPFAEQAAPQRTSTRPGQKRHSSDKSTSSSTVVRTPSWASSPGLAAATDEDVRTQVSDRTVTADAGRGRSTVVVFAAALGVTALVAGGGVFAYEKFFKARHTEVTSIDVPEPKPDDVKLGIDDKAPERIKEPPVDEKALKAKRDAEKARELAKQGDDALAGGNAEEALRLYTKAHETNPTPATTKRVAMAYMARGEDGSARKWLRQYVEQAPKAADAAFIANQLEQTP